MTNPGEALAKGKQGWKEGGQQAGGEPLPSLEVTWDRRGLVCCVFIPNHANYSRDACVASTQLRVWPRDSPPGGHASTASYSQGAGGLSPGTGEGVCPPLMAAQAGEGRRGRLDFTVEFSCLTTALPGPMTEGTATWGGFEVTSYLGNTGCSYSRLHSWVGTRSRAGRFCTGLLRSSSPCGRTKNTIRSGASQGPGPPLPFPGLSRGGRRERVPGKGGEAAARRLENSRRLRVRSCDTSFLPSTLVPSHWGVCHHPPGPTSAHVLLYTTLNTVRHSPAQPQHLRTGKLPRSPVLSHFSKE